MTTQLSKEQKIKLLSEDFLDRDSGTLVASRQSGRLNWESTIRSGGAYSEFILNQMKNLSKALTGLPQICSP